MTREQLESYKSKKAEILELQYKLSYLGEGDSMIGNSTINDYRTGYPRPQSIVGVDWKKCDRLEAKYRKQIEKLIAECEEIELWVEDIPDSMTRRIFRMYFVDGLSQNNVAKQTYLSQASVSEKISNFFKSDKIDKKV